MGKVIAGLWVLALLFGGFWFGYYQEGANRDIIIEFEGQAKTAGMPSQLESGTIYITKSRIAMVAEGKDGDTSKQIIDMKEKKAWHVLDKQKFVVVIPLKLVDKSECEAPKAVIFTSDGKVEGLPDSKTIAGLRCHAFKVGQRGEGGAVWVTYEFPLGREHARLVNNVLRAEAEAGPGLVGVLRMLGGKRPQVSGFQYFPLPFQANVRSRKGTIDFEVKSIKHGKVEESVFEIPSGYKEMDFQEVFKTPGGRG